MSKTAPQACVLTANRLSDGAVVYLDVDGAWNPSLAAAQVAQSPGEITALEDRGGHDAACNVIVEPYLADVRRIGRRIEPLRYRERVRAGGPTILDNVPGYVSDSPRQVSSEKQAKAASLNPAEAA